MTDSVINIIWPSHLHDTRRNTAKFTTQLATRAMTGAACFSQRLLYTAIGRQCHKTRRIDSELPEILVITITTSIIIITQSTIMLYHYQIKFY